ncbi:MULTISPECIES: NAD(P)/FAD-dependent oxidoreductase [unclassified Streptomyces]|uniref:NAD(P)/FAD-dependent oxidoreductase n=1 Tax=unclassified Streptomyces TaxID=2593676 RepID=UPI00168BC13B|nr:MULTISPECIES: FAD-dependent oxidoreductase [unclassified Streptomyces]MBD3003221.1 NAD(P)/FAD-dependent oxidoreductase [Streptomyces sp. 5-10]
MESYREPMSPSRRVVIVGGGMAGTRLAQQLAARGAGAGAAASAGAAAGPGAAGAGPGAAGADAGAGTGGMAVEVTIIGEEPHPAYNRVLLAEVLAGRYAPEVIALPAPAAGVRRLSGVRVVRIDRPTAEVVCDDGRRVPYDALVLATGSNPVLPPLRGLFETDGHELPDGVHAFRTMDDCLALGAAVRPGARAVVIGGGLLGVSAARALAQRGAQVVLAHQGEHLMERQLDPGASGLLLRHMAALGVEVHTECRVRGLRTRTVDGEGGGGRAVSAVELADGYALEADLVVLACGVRPRVGLARAAGLEVARGVVIDDELRTSDPRVFAIGDCAEHAGIVYGLAGAAQEQADVLAHRLSPTPPLPEPMGLRPLDPHRGSAPDPRQGPTPEPAPGDRFVGNRSAEGAPPSGSWGRNGWAQTGHRAAPGDETPTRHTDALPANHAAWAQPGHRAAPGDETVPRYHGTRTLTRLTLTAVPGSAGGSASGTDGPLDLAAFGNPTPAPGDDVIHLTDATRNTYRKVVVRGDRLLGGILLGDLGTVGALARTWESDEPLPATPLLHLLTNDGGS